MVGSGASRIRGSALASRSNDWAIPDIRPTVPEPGPALGVASGVPWILGLFLVFFVVVVLVVGVFLAEVFVAGAFLAEVLVAGAFVAADFLAGGFFAAAFLALDDAGFAAADLVVEAVPFAVDVFVAVVLVDLRATLEVTLLAAAAVLPASFFAVDRAMAPGPPIQPGCVAITTRVRRGYAFTVEASNKSATKTDVSVSHPVWQT